MGTPLCVQRYRLYLVFVPRPSAGGCPPCCSPLTKPSLLFAATPPHPSPQTRRGFPTLWGCPAAFPLVSPCVDLIGVVISAGAGGALCILPAALTLGVQDWGGGGVPIQPAGAPGCPHGAAEAGEGIRAEQPPPSSPHCIAIISIAPYGGSRCGVSSHPHPHPFLAGKQQWMQSSPSPS